MARQQLLLDRYRVIETAGSGGYGTVRHAFDTRLKRQVAIKCIKLSEADAARVNLLAMEARFKADAQADAEAGGGDGGSQDFTASGPSLIEDAPGAFEPLPWEDGSDGGFERGFPEDPEFLDAREKTRILSHEARVDKETGGVSACVSGGRSIDGGDAANAGAGADDPFERIPGLEEARTAAQLADANIVTVYDCEVHGDTAYVIMEYIEGKTLSALLREAGDDISLDVVAAVFSSVAHALMVAHEAGVLHLDIKPENVMVNEKGVVKVADFGLATLMDAAGQGTAGGGTIGYMPLEQMHEETLDVRTDEWALASLVYEMLSGSNPFRASSLSEAEDLIEEAELVYPSLCWDALDARADDVVFKALDPDPDERFESVQEFASALRPYLGSEKAGRRELAAMVREDEEEVANPPVAHERPPLIDRIGPRGASVAARVVSAAGAAMVGAVALVNIRPAASFSFGIASWNAAVFAGVLIATVALAVFRPRWGVFPPFAMFAAMLAANGAFVPAVLLLLSLVAWWWTIGRHDDGCAAVAFLQPVCGSFGMAAFCPLAAGALLTAREATATAGFAALSAFCLGCLGTGDLMTWDIAANAVTAVNPSISGANMASVAMSAAALPSTWIAAASWVIAAAMYAWFCSLDRRPFDVAGSVVAAAALVACCVLGAGFDALASNLAQGSSASVPASAWMPSPFALAGAIVPGIAGVLLAVCAVTDRVRLAEGEW